MGLLPGLVSAVLDVGGTGQGMAGVCVVWQWHVGSGLWVRGRSYVVGGQCMPVGRRIGEWMAAVSEQLPVSI